MSNLLQLLANYYKSVIESERIYNEYKYLQLQREQERANGNVEAPNPNDLVALQLQKQVNKLTSQVQTLTKQNDKLKETNKSQRIASEDKINTLQAIVQGLQETISTQNKINSNGNSSGSGGGGGVEVVDSNGGARTPTKQNKGRNKDGHGIATTATSDNIRKSKFHLLSPLGKNISSRSRSSNHTIFDDSSSESNEGDDIADKRFLNSSNSSTSKEIDSFTLSLKKYDESRFHEKLKDASNDKSNNTTTHIPNQERKKGERNGSDVTPTKHPLKRAISSNNSDNVLQNKSSNQIKKLNGKDIPNLSMDDSTTTKKRKLSNRKIQVTSDDEQLLNLES